ncbi:OmpA family protein [Varunaivibrio sulfuroxidans]|uniref:OmpA family protein n=1 Tax=Varunaivibrio sulfuroxidans TaxID=1773489 RepID=UPI001404AB51|nr:OmpA family protein [Varunaivibrio sulfuroxidans]WES31223.1 OmpA family protein [Varunaivibrio sulfuroxidans]
MTRLVALLALGAIAGCSSVPNAANPVEWYKSASDFFTGGDTAGQAKAPANGLVADKNAPKPQASKKTTPGETSSGLNSADGAQAYASEPIPRQSAPSSVLSETPPTAEAPAPAAQPVIAVTPEQIAPPPTQHTQTGQASDTSPPTAPENLGAVASKTSPLPPPVSPMAAANSEYGTVVIDGATAGRGAPEMSARKLAELTGANGAGGEAADSYKTVIISSDGVDTANVTESSGAIVPHKGELLFPSSAKTPGKPVAHGASSVGDLKVASILFANDSAGLDSRDVSILRAVRELQAERGGELRVVGHASSRTANMDPIRHKMLNFKLSVERADNVARKLVSLGVPKSAVQIVAVSDTEPLYYEVMPSGEAGNRRAEIFLVK